MPSFLDTLVGTKPVVPGIQKLNLGTEQQTAIAENQAALPGAQSLVGAANLFNIGQINQMLESAIPGLKDIQGSISKNIASEAKGEIPQDVQDVLKRAGAAGALTSGTGTNSGFGNNLTAESLGLTSLNLTQHALSSAESWMKTVDSIYAPGMLNVGSMFVSPTQQAQFDNEQNLQQFQQQWMQNQINAMPAPWATDLKQFVYRAMSAYSGTSVPNNPYSTPGSFGGGMGEGGGSLGGGGGFGGMSDFGGSSVEPSGYGQPFTDTSGAAIGDFGGGFGGGAAGIV